MSGPFVHHPAFSCPADTFEFLMAALDSIHSCGLVITDTTDDDNVLLATRTAQTLAAQATHRSTVQCSLRRSTVTGPHGERLGLLLLTDAQREAELRAEALANANTTGTVAHALAKELSQAARRLGPSVAAIGSHRRLLGESERVWLDHLEQSFAQIGRIATDLDRFARERGAREPAQRLDLEAVTSSVWSSLDRPTAAQLSTSIETGVREIDTAPSALRRVLENVLTNSVKYRHPDRELAVTVLARASAGGVEITVADNGVGIAPAQRDAAFLPFRRLHTADDVPGTGLGLTLVRELILSQGGRVWLDAGQSEGTEVHIWLPLRPSIAASREPGPVSRADVDTGDVETSRRSGSGSRLESRTDADTDETASLLRNLAETPTERRHPDPVTGLALLEQIFDSPEAPGVVILGADFEVLVWNRTVAEISGIPTDTALGRPVTEILDDIPESEQHQRLTALRDQLSRSPFVRADPRHSPTGWVRVHDTTVLDDHGGVHGVAALITPLSSDDPVVDALDRLALTGSEFVRGAAHDLVAPARALRQLSELLIRHLGADGPPDLRASLDRLANEARDLAAQITAHLDRQRPDSENRVT